MSEAGICGQSHDGQKHSGFQTRGLNSRGICFRVHLQMFRVCLGIFVLVAWVGDVHANPGKSMTKTLHTYPPNRIEKGGIQNRGASVLL